MVCKAPNRCANASPTVDEAKGLYCKKMMMRRGLRCGQGIEIDSPHSRPAAVSNAAGASRGPGLGTTPIHATRKLESSPDVSHSQPQAVSVQTSRTRLIRPHCMDFQYEHGSSKPLKRKVQIYTVGDIRTRKGAHSYSGYVTGSLRAWNSCICIIVHRYVHDNSVHGYTLACK
jgi:hypothetical protein